jgi:DNA polymerase
MLALPLSLDGVGEVLNIQRKKLKEGTDLVRYFSLPCKPTKTNGGRTRNLPEHATEKWADNLPLRADGYECNYYKKD